MNTVNEDLVFTVEVGEEFDDKRLPTLDVKMWNNPSHILRKGDENTFPPYEKVGNFTTPKVLHPGK